MTGSLTAWALAAAGAALMLGGLLYALAPLRRPFVSAGFVLLPLVVYAAVGRADLPDAPLAARFAQSMQAGEAAWERMSLNEAAARLAAYVRSHPHEAEAWSLLARTRAAQGEETQAQMAWARLLALEVDAPLQARAHLGFAEAQIRLNDGLVDETAAAHLHAAAALDGEAGAAQYWLGLRAQQQGDTAAARAIWQAARAAATDERMAQSLEQALASLPPR